MKKRHAEKAQLNELKSVEQLLAELHRVRGNARQAARVLRELMWNGTPEALDGLLGVLGADWMPIDELGKVWAEVLLAFDDARIAPALNAMFDRNLANGKLNRQADTVALWRLLKSKSGPMADQAFALRLSSDALKPNSVVRLFVLKALDGELSPRVRPLVVAHLADENAAFHAFQALLRAGDRESRQVALSHLIEGGARSTLGAQYFGTEIKEDEIESLRTASSSDPRLAAVYVMALSKASTGQIRAESAVIKRRILQVLDRYRPPFQGDLDRTTRRLTARAIQKLAGEIADPELQRVLEAEALTTIVGREALRYAARSMGKSLAE